MQSRKIEILLFILVSTIVILLMALLVIFLIYLYHKKQITNSEKINSLKLSYDQSLMQINMEIQESTLQQVSREIHDNISLTLTLAKLHLNSIDYQRKENMLPQIESSIELLSDAILSLNSISKSLNSDIINSYGLIKAVENEIYRIESAGLFDIKFLILGEPSFIDSRTELIIFRIFQEAFNNIIKHSGASQAKLTLEYSVSNLVVLIQDNGKGFNEMETRVEKAGRAGLKNMSARTEMIEGKMSIETSPNRGCLLIFTIPIN